MKKTSRINNFGAFLDSYYDISLVLPIDVEITTVLLSYDKNVFNLEIVDVNFCDNKKIIKLKSKVKIDISKDYYVKINEDLSFYLSVGKITLTEEFDSENYFDEWLGFKYNKDFVTFRLWAPVSKEVVVVIDEHLNYPLEKKEKGVFEIKIPNEKEWIDKKSYYYLIRNNLEFESTIDPYGYSISSSLDRCYVFDFGKTSKLKYSFSQNIKDPIIYELSVRDFTIGLPIKNKGEFLGILEASEIPNHGIDYLKNLGISYVQLMPVFAFGGVDYLSKESKNANFAYNWGYNPILYNALCGWFVSEPDNPYCQINEFKKVVDAFHKAKIGVNLDVVYNHVYETANYSLNKIVPGYPYRFFKDGTISNGSWCGNDIATERRMNRKFIIDSLKYFQDTFKIDGFRFDLMGLIDIDTIKLAKVELEKVNPNVILYGEGWAMNTAYPHEKLSTMFNYESVDGVGFFNDEFRNTLKGKDDQGGILLGRFSKNIIENLLKGTNYFEQSINYVECHDNRTFYDQQRLFNLSDEKIKENAKIIFTLVLFSKGISFIHSGQEVLRTKMGIDNSYNSSDYINKFPWHLTFVHSDLVDFVRKLIKIKKELQFSNYELMNVEVKNGFIKVAFSDKNNILKLYINTSDNILTVPLDSEDVLLGNEVVKNNTIIFRKNVVITKEKKQSKID